MTRELEQLLRDVLRDHTADVAEPTAGFADVRSRARRASRLRRVGVAAAVAVAAVGVVVPLSVDRGRAPSGPLQLQEVALVTAPTSTPVSLATLPPAATITATVPLGLTPERSLVAGNDVWVFGTDAHGLPGVALVRVDERRVVVRRTLPHPVCSSSVSSGVLVAVVTLGTSCTNTLRALLPIDASTLVPGAIIGGADGGDVLVRDDAVYDTAGGQLERRDRPSLHVNAVLPLGGTDNSYVNMAADPSGSRLWVTILDRDRKRTKLVEVDLDAWKVLGTRPIDADNGGIPYAAGNEVWVGGATGGISAVRHFDTALTPGTEVFAGGEDHAFFGWTGARLWQFDGVYQEHGALTCAAPDGTLLGSSPLPDPVPLAIMRADKHHIYLGVPGGRALQILTATAACAG